MESKARRLTVAAWSAVLIFFGILVAVPLTMLVRTSRTERGSGLEGLIAEPGMRAAIVHSLELSAAVTALAVPLGVALALMLQDPGLPWLRFWRVAVLLPLVIPDFVLGYSWLAAYGRAGLTSQLFGFSWPGINEFPGMAVIVSVSVVPLVYLIVTTGLAGRAAGITERAARASGARSVTVLRTVTLPLLAPAMATSAVLAFVLSLGSFAVPQVLGSPTGFETITTAIYAELSYASEPQSFVDATTLALLLVGITLVVVVPADIVLGTWLRPTPRTGADLRRSSGGRVGRLLKPLGLGGYLVMTAGLPLTALAGAAITRAVGLRSVPQNWTWDNFRAVLTPRTAQALGTSLLLALAAASILLVVGLVTASLGRSRIGRAPSVLINLIFVLPGSALAIGLLLGYGRWLAGSFVIILLAYLAKFWGLAQRPISVAVDRVSVNGLRAARASGAGLATGVRTIMLPAISMGVISGWILCFVTALHEVTMSSLLYGPGTETLAVVVLNSAELGQIGVTAALSVVVTAVVAVPGTVWWVIMNRRGRG